VIYSSRSLSGKISKRLFLLIPEYFGACPRRYFFGACPRRYFFGACPRRYFFGACPRRYKMNANEFYRLNQLKGIGKLNTISSRLYLDCFKGGEEIDYSKSSTYRKNNITFNFGSFFRIAPLIF